MKNYLSLLTIPILFFTACASDRVPVPAQEEPAAAVTPPVTAQQATHWEPIVYEMPPVPVPVEPRIIACDFMPHPVCGIPNPPAPVTIGCDLQRPPAPPPMITCAEPPFGPYPEADTLGAN